MSDIRDDVRERYAEAAKLASDGQRDPAMLEAACCGTGTDGSSGACCGPQEVFGAKLYDSADENSVPDEALLASLGCGNPTAVADLHAGEIVLDLGSGGGIDVLLSASRVGPHGKAYGLDMTDEMLALANANKARAGAENVEFLKGYIEEIPLPDEAVDVVISNCVINLAADKPAVFNEMNRVLKPGGRIGVSDIVADDELTPEDRAARGSYVGCIAGALSFQEYEAGLTAAGFTGVTITATHSVADGLHATIVKATKQELPT